LSFRSVAKESAFARATQVCTITKNAAESSVSESTFHSSIGAGAQDFSGNKKLFEYEGLCVCASLPELPENLGDLSISRRFERAGLYRLRKNRLEYQGF